MADSWSMNCKWEQEFRSISHSPIHPLNSIHSPIQITYFIHSTTPFSRRIVAANSPIHATYTERSPRYFTNSLSLTQFTHWQSPNSLSHYNLVACSIYSHNSLARSIHSHNPLARSIHSHIPFTLPFNLLSQLTHSLTHSHTATRVTLFVGQYT
jgi:hypothetical protein